jgi:hypothetical protein
MIQLQVLNGLTEMKQIACQLYEEMTFQKRSAEQKVETRSRALNYAVVCSLVSLYSTIISPACFCSYPSSCVIRELENQQLLVFAAKFSSSQALAPESSS